MSSFIFPFPFISSFYLSHTILVLVLVIEFLYNICGGSLLIVLSMIANICVLTSRKHDSIDDNGDAILTSTMSDLSINIFCGFYWWAYYIGVALVYTAQLCKIYRIKLITDQPLRRGVKILPKHVMIPYAIIMVTIITLLIVWFIIKYVTNLYTEEPYAKSCITHNKLHIIFTNVINGLIGCVSIAVTILAWKIRHINEELGDSKRILSLAVYEFFLFAIIGNTLNVVLLPHIYNMENLKIQLAVLDAYDTIFSFLLVIGGISFIVLPRIYFVWYEYKHGHYPEGVEMIGTGRTTANP